MLNWNLERLKLRISYLKICNSIAKLVILPFSDCPFVHFEMSVRFFLTILKIGIVLNGMQRYSAQDATLYIYQLNDVTTYKMSIIPRKNWNSFEYKETHR